MNQYLLLFVAGFLLSFASIHSDKIIRWEVIGHKKISNNQDRTEIPIKVLTNKSQAIRFSINNGNLEIHHAKLHFNDGEVQTVPLRRKYKDGNMTKIVDLNGGLRNIIKCELHYIPDRLAKSNPVIEFWARTEVEEGLVDGKQ
ncbi:MAG: DUF2541 family protein [Saprospiraceae bacterium]|nr:DUF2541 family protein [Saprospiraceae bacterium]